MYRKYVKASLGLTLSILFMSLPLFGLAEKPTKKADPSEELTELKRQLYLQQHEAEYDKLKSVVKGLDTKIDAEVNAVYKAGDYLIGILSVGLTILLTLFSIAVYNLVIRKLDDKLEKKLAEELDEKYIKSKIDKLAQDKANAVLEELKADIENFKKEAENELELYKSYMEGQKEMLRSGTDISKDKPLSDETKHKIEEQVDNIQKVKKDTNEYTALDWFTIALDHYYKSEWQKAIENYSKAIDLDPKYAAAYNNRGNAYDDQKKYERAIADYNKAIDLDPNYATAYNNRGAAYAALKFYDNAIADYSKAIELDPKLAQAYSNRGNAYNAQKEYEKAIADYSKAIDLDPNDAAAFYNRGNVYDDQKKYEKAIADYDKAIDLDPNIAVAYNNRGTAHAAKKDYDKAIADFGKAIELDANNALAYVNLAELQIIRDQFSEAIKTLEKGLPYAEENKDQAIFSYLRLIAEKALGHEVQELEQEFEILLEQDFINTFSFDIIDGWLEGCTLNQETKDYIRDISDKMKKHSA